MTAPDLERFVRAQDEGGTFERALGELRAGRKASHWMWFVFPQVAGLGRSPTAQHFAISGREEADNYLAHPILGPRLLLACDAVLAVEGRSAEQVFGSVDAMKLRSSMMLFARTAPDEPRFDQVLEKYFEGRPDDTTDELLA